VGDCVNIAMLQFEDSMDMETRDWMSGLVGHDSPLTLYLAPTFSYSLPRGGAAETA